MNCIIIWPLTDAHRTTQAIAVTGEIGAGKAYTRRTVADAVARPRTMAVLRQQARSAADSEPISAFGVKHRLNEACRRLASTRSNSAAICGTNHPRFTP